MKFLRLMFVGAGRVSEHYAKILDSGQVENFKIVSVVDTNSSASSNFSNYWEGCRPFTDINEAIKSTKPDLAIICTPSGNHYTTSKHCLISNIHTLVEKPSTLRPDESEELTNLAESKNLFYGVAFQNRFNPAIVCLKDAAQKGRFGKITTATIRLRWCRYQEYYNDGWHGTWLNDGGVINQQAIHHVDALQWIVGPVSKVCASMSNRLNTLEAEDTIVAILKFENGALGTIEATTAARPSDIEASISLIGEKGSAVIGGIGLNKIEVWNFLEPEESDYQAKEKYSEEIENGYGNSHATLLNKTIDSILSGTNHEPVSVKETLSTLNLIHSLYASIETNSWVSLADGVTSSKLGL